MDGKVSAAAAIAARLATVRERVAAAARRAGRKPTEVELVAVSKTFPLESIRAARQAGQRAFGENRVQEAIGKARGWDELFGSEPASKRPEWHLIGHLQTNKAREAAAYFDMIHSVDSLRLAEVLDREAQALGRVVPILLEVRLSAEPTKSGFELPDLEPAVLGIVGLGGVRLDGLMTIAPLAAPGELARPYFRRLREARDLLVAASRAGRLPAIDLPALSMGMSGDFEVAIEEGATLIRVGRAIFGER